jgi:hypothetical protein
MIKKPANSIHRVHSCYGLLKRDGVFTPSITQLFLANNIYLLGDKKVDYLSKLPEQFGISFYPYQ